MSSLRDREAFEYSPALETSASAKLKAHYWPFIDGAFVDGGGQVVQCVNPATEQPLTEVSCADERDVDTAVRAARRAYDKVWSKMAGAERGKYLFRIARLVAERAPELAVLETLQSGKPIRQSREFDLPAAAGQLFYYAGWADKLAYAGYGGGPQGNGPRPLGVVAQLVPGNFPLLTAAAKVAAALACGNTVVLKPAETTPLTALVLAEICQQAQLPPGVLNVVPGAADLGAALIAHREVDKIGFAGSTAVGKQIQRHIAGTRKRLTMELGGKSATVVFDDAPLEQAVEGVVNGFVFNQGQLGCAGSRLLVQEPIAQELLDRLRSRIAQLRVGDPLDKNTDLGALSSAAAVAQLGELVAAGVAEGATPWTSDPRLPEQGFFAAPTLFSDVQPAMRIAREEFFGPVLSVLTFRTPDEALAKANNTPYGLSAGVWTEKGSRMLYLAQHLRAGVVWANTVHRFDPTAAFGGYTESGLGREGGMAGLEGYLNV